MSSSRFAPVQQMEGEMTVDELARAAGVVVFAVAFRRVLERGGVEVAVVVIDELGDGAGLHREGSLH